MDDLSLEQLLKLRAAMGEVPAPPLAAASGMEKLAAAALTLAAFLLDREIAARRRSGWP